jgi:DNA-directed RNA polymerase subunit RPC12/RpoP
VADILEYKCPQCGGAIHFDSATQQMVCPYCDATFDVQALKDMDEALRETAAPEPDWNMPDMSWQDGEQENMAVYSCKSCGGEIVGDTTMGATSCPYCGNPVVMSGQFAGALRPDLIIPFKLDQGAAKAALAAHFKKKTLLPKAFKNLNHIDEVKGVYVPFWLFDCDVSANIRYDATKIRTWSDSKYDYVETSHFLITRQGDVAFDNVPVDGSSKMPDDLMESVEPFDYKAVTAFQTAYMAGYVADKYDVDAQASITRANERIKNSTQAVFASSVQGYTTVTPKSSNVNISDGSAKYALLPVWLLSTSWNKQQYLFAMNGQTGKLVGDLPMDKGAFYRWLCGVAAGVAVISFLLATFVF